MICLDTDPVELQPICPHFHSHKQCRLNWLNLAGQIACPSCGVIRDDWALWKPVLRLALLQFLLALATTAAYLWYGQLVAVFVSSGVVFLTVTIEFVRSQLMLRNRHVLAIDYSFYSVLMISFRAVTALINGMMLAQPEDGRRVVVYWTQEFILYGTTLFILVKAFRHAMSL